MKTLNSMLCSNGFTSWQADNSGNGMWLSDEDRKERIEDAAEDQMDGSTHAEVIQDWRDYLDQSNYSDEEKESITKEIDECEKWHEQNGTLNDIIG